MRSIYEQAGIREEHLLQARVLNIRLRCGHAVKAQGGVTLLQLAGPDEATILLGKRKAAAGRMFGDDEGFGGKNPGSRRTAEKAEALAVGLLVLVGRIEEDEIEDLREFLEQRHGASELERVVGRDAQGGEICMQRFEGGVCSFGKPHVACAAAERLDAYGSGAGVKVNKVGAGQARGKNVEEGLAEAVAGRTRGGSGRSSKEAGTVGSGDDAHGPYRNLRTAATEAHTIVSMTGWSFRLGRIFGVEIRLHSFFIFLLVLSMTWAAYLEQTLVRGAGLWLLLLLAVAVRELARSVAAAWYGLDLKSILLLPTGGLPTYASAEATERSNEAHVQKRMALVGPAANLVFGLTLAGLILTIAPEVQVWEMRWVTPLHLLRTAIWVNLLLAALNMLPAWPLDGGRVMQSELQRAPAGSVGGVVRYARLNPAIALSLMTVGLVTANWWLIMAGIGILLGAQIERQGLLGRANPGGVQVSDVMLTDYSILSASATLEDAVMQARHSLQDVFPVVRGTNMVGAVSRQTILEALEATGNGYVQGVMTRSFQTAAPADPLIATLNRVTGQPGASSQLVPVVEGERMVGILTPQNLHRSVALWTRRQRSVGGQVEEDEKR